jgi:5-methylcytosine-specific restriction endonuclease McrA
MIDSDTTHALTSSVLVLNRTYLAVHVVNVRRAFCMLYREQAEVIDCDDGRFANYDFEAWLTVNDLSNERDLSVREEEVIDDWVQAVNFRIRVPRVIRLLKYDRVPTRTLRFNRRNLFARDSHRCQYCGFHAPLPQLSVDHVVPRSQGGRTNWENVVCCCLTCNTRKGGRTPQQARMQLLKKPVKPRFNPLLARKLDNPRYRSWRAFLAAAGLAGES